MKGLLVCLAHPQPCLPPAAPPHAQHDAHSTSTHRPSVGTISAECTISMAVIVILSPPPPSSIVDHYSLFTPTSTTMRLSSTLLLLLATATTAPSSCLAFSVHNSQLHLPSQIPSNKYHSHRRQNLHGAAVTAGTTFSLSVSAASSTDIGAPGTADLPWSELGFEYRPTKSHLRMVHKDGKWGEAELVEVRELFRSPKNCGGSLDDIIFHCSSLAYPHDVSS